MPLIDDRASARRYLAPFGFSPWRWDDEGEVITWIDGQTIAFAPSWSASSAGFRSRTSALQCVGVIAGRMPRQLAGRVEPLERRGRPGGDA